MSDTDKYDQFDALMKLATYRMQDRDGRRAIGWRINFAAWALLVGIGTTSAHYPHWLTMAVVCLVILLQFLWERWNFKANTYVSKIMWAQYDAARALIQAPAEPERFATGASLTKHFPAASALVITFIIGALVIAADWMKPPPNPNNTALASQSAAAPVVP